MSAGWLPEDLGLAIYMVAILGFLGFCLVIGRKRWALVRQNNEKVLKLAEESLADRKRILAILEQINKHLQDRKT